MYDILRFDLESERLALSSSMLLLSSVWADGKRKEEGGIYSDFFSLLPRLLRFSQLLGWSGGDGGTMRNSSWWRPDGSGFMNDELSVMRVFLAPGSRGSQRFWRILFLGRNKVGWDPWGFGTFWEKIPWEIRRCSTS